MQESLFTVAKLDDFVPSDHPLRAVQILVNEALGRLNGLFNAIYADSGRESIAPEKLMRALLLQVFYSVRSERQLMEQMRYNLLFRWFVGLALDEGTWDHSVFSKNRDRLRRTPQGPTVPPAWPHREVDSAQVRHALPHVGQARHNKAACALANKMTGICYATLRDATPYGQPAPG